MIIPRTSKQFIGGAIFKRDREDYVPAKPFDEHGNVRGPPRDPETRIATLCEHLHETLVVARHFCESLLSKDKIEIYYLMRTV